MRLLLFRLLVRGEVAFAFALALAGEVAVYAAGRMEGGRLHDGTTC